MEAVQPVVLTSGKSLICMNREYNSFIISSVKEGACVKSRQIDASAGWL